MQLLELTCRNFRCLSDLTFRPTPGVNVIRGNNAQGKTSLLEALLFAATSKSHRTSVEHHLLAHNATDFHIAATVQRKDRTVRLEANWWNGVKRFKINGIAQTRISDILGKVCVVLFTPEDIALVKGGASLRRQFLDMELSQVSPPYLAALQQYRQALRQRNELLRAPVVDEDQLDVWDVQLVTYGLEILSARTAYVAELSELAAHAYALIARDEVFHLVYQPDIDPKHDFAAVLRNSRASDIKRRLTNHGPHRDDVDLLIGGRPARAHASQGQQKSAALALKLADTNLVFRRIGEYPVLMLDEVLSELDSHRARTLFGAFDEQVQCIVTTTEVTARNALFERKTGDFLIENGHLTQLDCTGET